MYREYAGQPQSEIEEVLHRAGRGSFVREKIDTFARYIAAGDRPVLTGEIEEPSEAEGHERFRSHRTR